MSDSTQITPNVIITDLTKRRTIGVVLYVVALFAGLAGLFFAFFPEAAFGTDIPTRAVAFANAAVSLLAGGFGLVITTPNVPKP